MEMKRLSTSLFSALILTISSGTLSAASIVGTNNMRDLSGNVFAVDEEFFASNGGSPDNTGFVFLHFDGLSFVYGGPFLDDGASLFFVEKNDVFSEENILGDDFVELKFDNLYSLPMNFFLGIRTPHLDVKIGTGYPPAYGWAEIENDGSGELSLVNHAMAYGAAGIVVNTTKPIPIPEPNTVTLIVGTVLFVLVGRTR